MKAARRKSIESSVSENEIWSWGRRSGRGWGASSLSTEAPREQEEHWHFYLFIEFNLCDGRAASTLIFLTRIIPACPPPSVLHTNTHSHKYIHNAALKLSIKCTLLLKPTMRTNDRVVHVCALKIFCPYYTPVLVNHFYALQGCNSPH